MWDRGLHSYRMVQATLAQKCDYLGRVPKNVKFPVEKILSDGSYLSWIAPDGKSKKKGGRKILVRVVEYTIDTDSEPQVYRLITSLTDIAVFPALLLATEYHRRWEVENTIDELKVHLNGRKTPIRSLNQERSCSVSLWLASWALGCAFPDVPGCQQRSNFPVTIKQYLHTEYCTSGCSQISAARTTRNTFFFTWLVMEILDEQIPETEGRSNPRVVKKTRAKFPSKKPIHKGAGVKKETLSFSVLNTA